MIGRQYVPASRYEARRKTIERTRQQLAKARREAAAWKRYAALLERLKFSPNQSPALLGAIERDRRKLRPEEFRQPSDNRRVA